MTNALSHSGIKGQKWGVRRFQNEDRTWTEEGKIRYGKNSGRLRGQDQDNDPHNRKGSKTSAGVTAASLALHLASGNVIGLGMDVYRLGKAAQANAKEHAAVKRLSTLETDKESGLKLKAKETTVDEDLKLTNPGYHNFNTNTKNNCALCSAAFELRRRGYDCIAQKAGYGYTPDEQLKWFKGSERKFFHDDIANAPLRPNRAHSQELLKWTEKDLVSQGNGARGFLSAYWSKYSGHSMAYEVKDGKVVVYDAQSGKKYTLDKIAKMSVDMGYTRIDNKEPDWAAMKAAGVI